MKNQFLSLMVCTAFFSTTPGFCMEPETEELQDYFRQVSMPTQLTILDHIDDKSVCRMKCVSRHFKNLLTAERPQITLKIIYRNGVLQYKESYDTINFSLFRSNREYNTHISYFSLTSPKQLGAEVEIDVPLFLLSGQTVKFLAEIREPFHYNFFKLEKFQHSSGKELTKSELLEGSVLIGCISASSNLMMGGDNWVSLFFKQTNEM